MLLSLHPFPPPSIPAFTSTFSLPLCFYPSFNILILPPTHFFIFCSYKASVILALVHPFSYCCSALLLPWLLAVFLSCPSLLLLWYEMTVCVVANFSKLFKAFKSELPTFSPLFSKLSEVFPCTSPSRKGLIFHLVKTLWNICNNTRQCTIFPQSYLKEFLNWQNLHDKPRGWWHALREWPL